MSRRDRDLNDEIQAHLAMERQRRIDAGETPEEADVSARRDFGNVGLVKEVTRSMWSWSALESVARDLRFGLRALRRNLGFTAVVVLSLALGIGGNTAIFSILNAVMLRTLPVASPEDLHLLRMDARFRVAQRYSYPVFRDLRAAAPNSVAAASQIQTLYTAGESDPIHLQLISGEFFPLLGLNPALGRLLAPSDNVNIGGHPVAVISESYWRQRMGGAADAVGRDLLLAGTRFTIVGVAPPGFHGVYLEVPTDVWVPLMMQNNVRYMQNFSADDADLGHSWISQDSIQWLDVLVRAPAQSRAAILSSLNGVLQRRLAERAPSVQNPERRKQFLEMRLTLESYAHGRSRLRDQFTPHLLALMGMVVLVLLIACANTANLLLARAAGRQREIALRLSIGAGRARLIQQLLTESLLLAAIAAPLGLLLAFQVADVFIRMAAGDPSLSVVHLDARILLFTLAVSVATALLFGLAPAFRATKMELGEALKTSSRSVAGGRRWNPAKILVAAQVTFSLLLVTGAGLFARSLYNLAHVPLGFDKEHVLSLWINPQMSGLTMDQMNAMTPRMLERLRSVPGVRGVSVAMCGLVSGCRASSDGFRISGYEGAPGEDVRFLENRVSAGYFSTVGTTLLRGRDFDTRDNEHSPEVAVVNQAVVRKYFANREPLGQYFGESKPTIQIIGVVEDARSLNVRTEAEPMVFYPLSQSPVYPNSLDVRTTGDPERVAAEARRALREVASNLMVDRVTTLASQVHGNLDPERLVAILTSIFGGLALGLACFGLYGVMSYSVARRTREIGVRMALGAHPSGILRSVLRESLWPVIFGVAAGVPLALFAGALLTSSLSGVGPRDWPTLLAAIATLSVVAALAALVPAWRASRVEPVVALRQE